MAPAALGSEQRYLSSAKRLEGLREDRKDTMPFNFENLDFLVQKFLHKDTQSTIRLNSSLGHFGDEILGDTFQKEDSRRESIVTTGSDKVRREIGVVTRQSDPVANRVSVISTNTVFHQSKMS